MIVIWVFAVLILTSSYTASLASILTVQQFQPAATDLQTLIDQGQKIGYQLGSFVVGKLKEKNASDEQIVGLSTDQEYADVLLNGTVAAIVDEVPYIKVFLSKHCSGFMMVGPTYKTDGFGFVCLPLSLSLAIYLFRLFYIDLIYASNIVSIVPSPGVSEGIPAGVRCFQCNFECDRG